MRTRVGILLMAWLFIFSSWKQDFNEEIKIDVSQKEQGKIQTSIQGGENPFIILIYNPTRQKNLTFKNVTKRTFLSPSLDKGSYKVFVEDKNGLVAQKDIEVK